MAVDFGLVFADNFVDLGRAFGLFVTQVLDHIVKDYLDGVGGFCNISLGLCRVLSVLCCLNVRPSILFVFEPFYSEFWVEAETDDGVGDLLFDLTISLVVFCQHIFVEVPFTFFIIVSVCIIFWLIAFTSS